MSNVITRLFKICPCCGQLMQNVEKRRQSTAYAEDDLNYIECCEECYERIEEEWAELWEDYYSQRF